MLKISHEKTFRDRGSGFVVEKLKLIYKLTKISISNRFQNVLELQIKL